MTHPKEQRQPQYNKASSTIKKGFGYEKPLAEAYYLKEDLRQLWNQQSYKSAELFLDDWIKRAQSLCAIAMHKLTNSIAGHR